MVKRVAVLTSGGDAPGMNACLRAIVRSSLNQGLEVFAIREGYKGLIEDNIFQMQRHSVSDIINRGGTIIGTARLKEFVNLEVQKKAVEILHSHGIDALIAIGGDGTYKGALALHKLGIHTISIPGTIDNDIASTDYSIGFDTALNTIIECVDKLRDTSTSHQRCSVIEVMGHRCGDLAAYAGIACGAEITLINEKLVNRSEVIEDLKRQKSEGKRHAMVIVAEKITNVEEFAHEIEREVGFETRSEVLGHMQRGGVPSAFDRVLASRLGDYAVSLLAQDISGVCLGTVNNKLVYTPVEEALKMERHNSIKFLEVAHRLA
ncbi:MAG TPA: 6-phosphofructokinase [Firmicutes bacterium]|nr:6-phosphofructokinase [Bacillota bacterium]